ncbi:MAG TPA: PDZ domain-containing protein, partial [Gemmata sp.]|nr:PDZ domain-containing protein [Gemmata sp.]
MNGIIVITALLAPASPVPAKSGTTPAGQGVDRNQALTFARMVYQLAMQATVHYAVEKKNHDRELIESAIRGLHEAAGVPVPEKVAAAVRRAAGPTELIEVLADARVLLGNNPKLTGTRSLFAAMNGFKYATDPSCHLVSPRMTNYASIDQDFGIGIELEGVTGLPWTIYHVESSIASGRAVAQGWFGSIPRVEDIPIPATFPWRVHRVIAGSPAQKAGVQPGDLITHLNGTEITAQTAKKLFFNFASDRQLFDPQTGRPASRELSLTLHRGAEQSFTASMKTENYTPETVFGVVRNTEDKWDCMLDRKYKIGYIRLGSIEQGAEAKFAAMMAELSKQGCRGLILDLRWCPGGFVNPG